MALEEYNRKRDFEKTAEPPGQVARTARGDSFVIQKHAATRLHYDFRLELDGVLLSWSIPKGPSLDPTVKRLAVHVEDHPLDYATFEGIIPKGQYGGGTVLLWDRGTWAPAEGGDAKEMLAAGNLKFLLKGEKVRGKYALIKIKERRAPRKGDDARNWLLIKERDAEARPERELDITEARAESVATGRTMAEIAADPSHVWHSNRVRVETDNIEGAKAAKLPARPHAPKRATRAKPPEGGGWLHEMQVEGTRLVARATLGSDVALFHEDGEPFDGEEAAEYAAVGNAIRLLPAQDLVVEAVATALHRDGHPDASALHDALVGAGEAPLAVYLTDVLFLDGHDLAKTPLARRKELLAALVARVVPPGPLRVSEHVAGNGAAFLRAACAAGLRGIVSRRADGGVGAAKAAFVVPCPAANGRA
ncbi:MAG TPA: DNA polymerase ligase N-terminal domain-containing protein [Polyangia bacterium]|nr:DNA polymerase ligase N-terminal domain-containing protein [Polyangia bacterium]